MAAVVEDSTLSPVPFDPGNVMNDVGAAPAPLKAVRQQQRLARPGCGPTTAVPPVAVMTTLHCPGGTVHKAEAAVAAVAAVTACPVMIAMR